MCVRPDRLNFPVLAWCAILGLAVLAGGAVRAASVDAETAGRMVRGWLSLEEAPLGAELGEVDKVKGYGADESQRGGTPQFYIVSLAPSGFVAVPGDDRLEPVIAFVPYGPFIDSYKHPAGALIKHGMAARWAELRAETAQRDGADPEAAERFERNRTKWAQLLAGELGAPLSGPRGTYQKSIPNVRVAPLIETRWGQGNVTIMVDGEEEEVPCFNTYTPGHHVCGCVGLALAQVLRYHKHPTVGVGNRKMGYEIEGWLYDEDKEGRLRGGDDNGGPYEWEMMPEWGHEGDEDERNAIGRLCWDTAIAVHMTFGKEGSSAYTADCGTALRGVFRYGRAKNSDFLISDQIPHSLLMTLINPGLDAGLPSILGITEEWTTGGHAVVCDGYGYYALALFHHLNFGWYGGSDGWYILPDIGTKHNYDVIGNVVYNISPEGSGVIVSGRVTDTTGEPMVGVLVKAGIVGENGALPTVRTDGHGIFAFPEAPPETTFRVEPWHNGYSFVAKEIETGNEVSGNVWGVDFIGAVTHPVDSFVVGQPPGLVEGVAVPLPASITTGKQQGKAFEVYIMAVDENDDWAELYEGPAVLTAHNADGPVEIEVIDTGLQATVEHLFFQGPAPPSGQFHAMDSNWSNRVNRSEWALGGGQPYLFSQIDTNGDGGITADEAWAARYARQTVTSDILLRGGVWNGTITVNSPQRNMWLELDAGLGLGVTSNLFSVLGASGFEVLPTQATARVNETIPISVIAKDSRGRLSVGYNKSVGLLAWTGTPGELLFVESFETGDLDGWLNAGGAYEKGIDTAHAAGGRYALKLQGGAGGTNDGVLRVIDACTPNRFDFDIFVSGRGERVGTLVLADSLSKPFAEFGVREDGTMGMRHGTTWYTAQYQLNTWTRVSLLVNWQAKTLELRVGDTSVATGIPFVSNDAAALNVISIFNPLNGTSAPVWFDNLLAVNADGGEPLIVTPSRTPSLSDDADLKGLSSWMGDIRIESPGEDVVVCAYGDGDISGQSARMEILGIDHYEWQPIGSPQDPTAPFEVAATAFDIHGQPYEPVAGYPAPLHLTALAASGGCGVEMNGVFQNPSFEETNPPGWTLNSASLEGDSSTAWKTDGARSAQISCHGTYAAGAWVGISQNVDLTGVSCLVFDATTTVDNEEYLAYTWSTCRFQVCVDGTPLWCAAAYDTTWLDVRLSVSQFSGMHNVSFRLWFEEAGDFRNYVNVDNIRTFAPGADGLTVTPATLVPSEDGVWRGLLRVTQPAESLVLVASDDQGRSAESNAFDVESDAAANEVAYFEWSDVSTPQQRGVPFDATITARDALGQTVTDFSDYVDLQAWTAGGSRLRLIGQEPPTEFPHAHEDSTYGYEFTPEVDLRVTHVRHRFGSKVSVWESDGTQVLSVSVSGPTDRWNSTALPSKVTLQAGKVYRIGGLAEAGSDAATSGAIPNTFQYGTIGNGYFRSGDGMPNASSGQIRGLVDLTFNVSGNVLAVDLSQSYAGRFIDGQWTGTLAVTETADGMFIRARDDAGHTGDSPFFDTVPPVACTLTVNAEGGGEGRVRVDAINRDLPYTTGGVGDSVVTLEPLPDPGWLFSHWTGDADGDAEPLALTLARDMTVTAVFVPETPQLTTLPDTTNGAVRLSWTGVDKASHYLVECSSDSQFHDTIDSGWIEGTEHAFEGLDVGAQYWYRVKAAHITPGDIGELADDFEQEGWSGVGNYDTVRAVRGGDGFVFAGGWVRLLTAYREGPDAFVDDFESVTGHREGMSQISETYLNSVGSLVLLADGHSTPPGIERLDDYVFNGGALVVFEPAVHSGVLPTSLDCCPVSELSGWEVRTGAEIVAPSHPVATDLDDSAGLAGYSTAPTLKDGAEVVVEWADGTPLVVTYAWGHGRVVYINDADAWTRDDDSWHGDHDWGMGLLTNLLPTDNFNPQTLSNGRPYAMAPFGMVDLDRLVLPSGLKAWGTLTYSVNHDGGRDQDVDVQVLAGDKEVLLADVPSGADLAALGVPNWKAVSLRFILHGPTSRCSAELESFSLTWQTEDKAVLNSPWSGVTTAEHVGAAPPTPVLDPEPPRTAGTSNTISWPAIEVDQFLAQCSTEPGFTNPVSTGWIAATEATFDNLVQHQHYFYRVKSARLESAQTVRWEESYRDDFASSEPDLSVRINPIGAMLAPTSHRDVVDVVGGPYQAFESSRGGRMNAYHNWTAADAGTVDTLHWIEMFLDIPCSVALTFVVYEDEGLIHSNTVANSGTGRRFYNSGEIDVPLVAGRKYWIGCYWSGPLTYFRADGEPTDTAFGRHGAHVYSDLPTPDPDPGSWLTDSIAYYMRFHTSREHAFRSEGFLTSPAIVPDTLTWWGELTYEANVDEPGTSIEIDVLDAGNDTVLVNNAPNGFDLSGLSAAAIRLRARLATTDPAHSPRLRSWSVTWQAAQVRAESAWSEVEDSIQGEQMLLVQDQDPPEGGNSSSADGDWSYDEGEDTTVTAYAKPGWEISHWSGDVSGNSSQVVVTMDDHKAITAHFRPLPPVLDPEPETTLDTGNTISWPEAEFGQEYYAECASNADFTLPQDSGWVTDTSARFDNLTPGVTYYYRVRCAYTTQDAQGQDRRYESEWSAVESSKQENFYTLTTSVFPQGTGTVETDPEGPGHFIGQQVELRAIGERHWTLGEWQQDPSGTNYKTFLTMDNNKWARAQFVPISPYIEYEPHETPGAKNTIVWLEWESAHEYLAQASRYEDFRDPISSGWISGTSYEFTGLYVEHTYYYRAKAAHLVAGDAGGWWQPANAPFTNNQLTSLQVDEGGAVRLGGIHGDYAETGTMVSPLIEPDDFHQWGDLTYTPDVKVGTTVTVDVLDADDNVLAGDVEQNQDLHALGIGESAIKLRLTMTTTDPTLTPTLSDWGVVWFGVRRLESRWGNVRQSRQLEPRVNLVSPGVGPTDAATPVTITGEHLLDVSAVYLPDPMMPGDTIPLTGTPAVNAEGTLITGMSVPAGLDAGHYDVMVVAGGAESTMHMGSFQVYETLIHVDDDMAPGGDGLSWATARKTIGAALDQAGENDIVWVAEGTYQEALSFDKSVAIYGGFDTTEEAPGERDIAAHPSVIDVSGAGPGGQPAKHALVIGMGPMVLFDGFTITGGVADGAGDDARGGGLLCMNDAGGTFRRCTFTGNAAGDGGAVYCGEMSMSQFRECVFTDNRATRGGALFADLYASPSVVNCLLVGNRAGDTGGAVFGAVSSSASFTNCTVAENRAGTSGGGFENAQTEPDEATPYVANTIVWGNTPDQVHGAEGDLSYCCVQDGATGTMILTENPHFLKSGQWDDKQTPGDLADDVWTPGDYRLQGISPCIDAGSPDDWLLDGVHVDLAGNPRLQGEMPGEMPVDIGPYEGGVWASAVVTDDTGAPVPVGAVMPDMPDSPEPFLFAAVPLDETPVTRTFTIANTGDEAPLVLGSGQPDSAVEVWSESGEEDAFSVVTQPANSVAPQSETTFEIRYSPAALGESAATVTINANAMEVLQFTVVGVAPQPLTLAQLAPGTADGLATAQATVDSAVTLFEGHSLEFAVDAADGFPELTYTWTLDGQPVGGNTPALDFLPGHDTVEHPNDSRTAELVCTVTDARGATATATWTTIQITDIDRHAEAPAISLSPPEPGTLDEVAIRIDQQTPDPDGDPIEGYLVRWTEVESQAIEENPVLDPRYTAAGQEWEVSVIPQTNPYGWQTIPGMHGSDLSFTVARTPPTPGTLPMIYVGRNKAAPILLTANAPDAGDGTERLTFGIANDRRGLLRTEHGTVIEFFPTTGALTYEPDADYTGPDSLRYFVESDVHDPSPSREVQIEVVDAFIPIHVMGGGLETIEFGTAGEATPGFDNGTDQFAPPQPGGTGVVGFTSDLGELLQRDLRTSFADSPWQIEAAARDDEEMILWWSVDDLPADTELALWQVAGADGPEIEGSTILMRETPTVTLPVGESAFYAIGPVMAPAVDGVAPTISPLQGGVAITITGSGFQPGVRVFFGAAEALSVTRESETTLTATTPPHSCGHVALEVRNPHEQSTTAPFLFGYSTPPVADPGGPYQLADGDPLTLDGSGSSDPDSACNDAIVTYAWDLDGDGEFDDAQGATPALTPEQVDNLGFDGPADPVTGLPDNPVALRVTDAFGMTGQGGTTLAVYTNEPRPAFVTDPPASPMPLGVEIGFDASPSTHGHPGRAIVLYEWDFDYNNEFSADATGLSAAHAFDVQGTYTVMLRVTDDNDPARTATTSLEFNVVQGNVAPVARAGGPYVVSEGQGVTLDAGQSHDPNQGAGDAIAAYEWDLNGDGVFDDAAEAQVTLSWNELRDFGMAYPADPATGTPGNPVALRVTDGEGLTNTDQTTVTIYRNQPIAEFSVEPDVHVACGETVTFDAAASRHGHPAYQIVLYEWDFGLDEGAFAADATGATAARQFDRFGSYEVTLRVTDDNPTPRMADTMVTVHVDQGNRPPVAAAGGPYDVPVLHALQLDAGASADPDAACGDSIADYAWDVDNDGAFDDADTATVQLTWQDILDLDLAQSEPGLWTTTVWLRVTDSLGETAEADAVITVRESNSSWIFTLDIEDGSEDTLMVGMTGQATGGFDTLYDEEVAPPRAPEPHTVILGSGDRLLRRSIHAPATYSHWILELAAADDTPCKVRWDSSDVPAGGLFLFDCGVGGVIASGGERLNLASAQSITVPAGETRHLRLCYGHVEHSLKLLEKWNFVSTPVEPFDPRVSKLFEEQTGPSRAGVELQDRLRGVVYSGSVWAWDPRTTGESGYYPLEDLHALEGCCLYTETEIDVLVTGVPVLPHERVLNYGWNLLGVREPAAVAANPDIVFPLWIWDAGPQVYKPVERGSEIVPGKAYWIYALQPTFLESVR